MERQVSLVQYGLGHVGQALLRQVLAGRKQLAARTGLDLRHVAVVDSRGLLADPRGLSDAALRAALAGKAQGQSLDRQPGGQPRPAGLPPLPSLAGPTVLVDVTAADGMEKPALDALDRGWGVVLANKRPLAGDLETFRRLTGSRRLRHEATVGAGLPWIETLSHLLDTGDRILRLEAAVSGTLGYLFSQLEAGVAFSAAVAEARARGFTEPDPRDDLAADDVRRKGLILARLLGRPVKWDDLPAEPLYPRAWDALDVAGFMAALPELDDTFRQRVETARATGHVLRYSIEINEESCSAGLREVPCASPLGTLQGPNCLLAIHSMRYQPAPLVISGPGAGAEVTAAGVYADLITLGLEL